MTCSACAARVERRLSELEGVGHVSVNYATESAVVSHTGVPSSRMVQTIEKAGYGVRTLIAETVIDNHDSAARIDRLKSTLADAAGVVSTSVDKDPDSDGHLIEVRYIPDLVKPAFLSDVFGQARGSSTRVVSTADALAEISRIEADRFSTVRRKLFLSALLSGAIMYLSMNSQLFPSTYVWHLVLFMLSLPVIFYAGAEFFKGAFIAARLRSADMNTLVALGVGSAFIYSTSVFLFPSFFSGISGGDAVYFEAAVMIVTLILAGRMLEARARTKTGEAIRALIRLQPNTANLLRDGRIVSVPIESLSLGDLIRVLPGESIPADGIISEGRSSIDESMLTGESIPAEKSIGDRIWAGTLNTVGTVDVTVSRLGEDALISQIVRSVKKAQESKAPVQALADRISAIFVPVVLLIAMMTAAAWAVWGPEPVINNALLRFVTVLIIACPCALGLATPTAIVVGTGRAAAKGILLRGGDSFQKIASLSTVLVDKTGTLTEGRPEVVDIIVMNGYSEEHVLAVAAALEHKSEHPLAKAIRLAGPEFVSGVDEFKVVPGEGVSGIVDGAVIRVGTENYVTQLNVDSRDKRSANSGKDSIPKSSSSEQYRSWLEYGHTIISVSLDATLIGQIAIADQLRDSAKRGVDRLKDEGLSVIMVTGDQAAAANRLGSLLDLDHVHSGIRPEGKRRLVEKYQLDGQSVAMVGDGINDAPALAQADIGIAIGSGSDIAIEAGDITIISGDVGSVADAIRYAKKTLRVIYQNLGFAFIYNILLIPVAAGVLYPMFGLTLSPVMASAAMALSSISVLGNSLRLKRM